MTAERIKIFVDAHSFDTEFQGAQTFVRELYMQLMADHPELDVYFGTANISNFRNSFPDVPAKHILPYIKRNIGALRLVFDIPRYIRQYQFDFAHFQYIAPRKIGKCKYIVTLHDVLYNEFHSEFPLLYRLSRNILFGRSIKKADIKTTVSAYSKEGICYYYSIPESEVHIIPNGVKLSPRELDGLGDDAAEAVRKKFAIKDYILCTSRIEPRKNQALLLKTYLNHEIYRMGIPLVFVGKESIDDPELTDLIDNLSGEQKKFFHWLPQVRQSDLADLYSACKLFVYPSKAEGFGIPPLEAGIRQVPVLCSDTTAMKDFTFFRPHTFDPRDEKEFAEKLLQLLNTPPSATDLSEVAAQIQRRYSWEKSSQQFYNLLQTGTSKQTKYETEDSDFGYAGNP
jgi:glycosyltransferase involved in cell wall biosynthesis